MFKALNGFQPSLSKMPASSALFESAVIEEVCHPPGLSVQRQWVLTVRLTTLNDCPDPWFVLGHHVVSLAAVLS